MSDHAREIVDRFISVRTGVSVADLKPGQVAVATCDRRSYAELGFGFIRLLWAVHFGDRALVSVHPAALPEVSRLVWGQPPDAVLTSKLREQTYAALASALPGAALGGPPKSDLGIKLYHPGDAQEVESDGEVRLLTAADVAKWPSPRAYMAAGEHPCAARREAFGLFVRGMSVAEVMTHDPSVADMAHLIAEDGIEVAEGYRRRGYGRAVLAAWTREMQRRGRACLHGTSLENVASVGVARSIGYVEYARNWSISYSPPEEEHSSVGA
jgi:ribosomal protein S18 acetylase RimI-like enzyme